MSEAQKRTSIVHRFPKSSKIRLSETFRKLNSSQVKNLAKLLAVRYDPKDNC